MYICKRLEEEAFKTDKNLNWVLKYMAFIDSENNNSIINTEKMC